MNTNRIRVAMVAGALASASFAGVAGAAPAVDEHAALVRLDGLFADATPGSPAQFRLAEERDRVTRIVEIGDELDHLAEIGAGAAAGSPAQRRAQEAADSLVAERQRLAW